MYHSLLAILAAAVLVAPGAAAPPASPVVPPGTTEIDGKHWAFSSAPITGTLRDATRGFPLTGVRVRFKREAGGEDHFHEVRTDEKGFFRVLLRFGTYFVDLDVNGYASIRDQEVYTGLAEVSPPLNLPMSTPVGEGEIRIALSWTRRKGGAVKDVDSYLQIPGAPPSAPLCYKRTRKDYHGADLDLDDTDWEGPETVTIRRIRPGRYIYYVNNFSSRKDCEALGRSGVRVAVTQGSRTIRTYLLEPSTVRDGNGITYRLFYIENGIIHDTDEDGKPYRRYDDSLFIEGTHETSCQNEPPMVRWDILEATGEGGSR